MKKTWAIVRDGDTTQLITGIIAPSPEQFPGCEIYECDGDGRPVRPDGTYVPLKSPSADPPIDPSASKAAEARMRRDNALRASDWTQLADVPAATQNLWRTYRQALRDLPQQANFPDQISWPTPPA